MLQHSPTIITLQRQLSIKSQPSSDSELYTDEQFSLEPKVFPNSSLSTATCHPSQQSGDYERMIHPRQPRVGKDEASRDPYIVMQPALFNRPESALAQLRLADTNSSTPFPPLAHSAGQFLESIDEDKTDYENFPFWRDIENESFTYYTQSYENIQQVREGLASSTANQLSINHKEMYR